MRRRRPEKRTILPDPIYNDLVVAKFINYIMVGGKKSVAEKIFYNSLEIKNSPMYIKLYELLQKSIQLIENSGVTIEDSKYVTIY